MAYKNTVRRKDRQQTETAFFAALLNSALSCTVGIEKEGHPLLQPTFFFYDEPGESIVFHSSRHGYIGSVVKPGLKATVSVFRYGKMYTAERAYDFGGEYESVIVYGTAEIVEGEERMPLMQRFFKKYFSLIPEGSYQPIAENELKNIFVVRIKIEDWFGKKHLTPEYAKESFYHSGSPLLRY